jgi:poly(hydroxyalkanoate) depolymerase family esterase
MDWPRDLRLGPMRLGTNELRRVMRQASSMVHAPWMEPTPFATTAAREGVVEVADFGSNPGALRMLVHAASTPPRPGSPLIVVLHGCNQQAAQFAADSGWTGFADRIGAPLLLPEQRQENNSGCCFNWFRASDTRRGRGEALSIRQMVQEAVRRFGADPRQVFVVGLSAGGAMAAAMLASYPDAFAAGAVVAGLPVGCAASVPQALSRMSHAGPEQSAEDWADLVRLADGARHRGDWPRISIWHGAEDRTVDPANADLLALQWRTVGEVGAVPILDERLPGDVRHRAWGRAGAPAVEQWTVPGLAHGYPIAATQGDGSHAARWVLTAPVAATERIAAFWKLA